jgi:hypothetical protein
METPGILAIDFGTTNSYFCKCPAHQISPVGVDFGTGRDGLPTAILYRGQREPLVGDAALHEYGEASDSERAEYRLRTQFKPDIVDSAEAASTAIDFLGAVVAQSRRQHIALDPAQRSVILGVPSESQDRFRARLSEIADAAGFGEVRLVDEPKGALLYHLWHKDFSPEQAQKGILVVDFGGGTCDFAILQNLQVCHSWGQMELGGRLFDDLFFQWFLEQNPAASGQMQRAGDAYYIHSYLCREVKEFFSLTMARDRSETVNKSVGRYGALRGLNWTDFVAKAKAYRPSETFADHLRAMDVRCEKVLATTEPIDLIDWFRQSLERGLVEASTDPGDIGRVILAGGSSQWPFVPDVICEVMSIERAALMRSDRPYAVIAQGLAILPALQKKFDATKEKLRGDLPQFCRTQVRPLVESVTDSYVAGVADDVTAELFDTVIRPVLEEFRNSGGSARALRETVSAQVDENQQKLHEIIQQKLQTLRLGLPGQLNGLLSRWFGSFGLSVGDEPVGEAQGASIGAEAVRSDAPDLYGSIMETVGWFVVALATTVGAMVSGGGGMALLATGPVGLVAGAVLSAVAAVLAVRYGKARARELADTWNAPAWVVKRALSASRIAKMRAEFKTRLQETLRRETAALQDELEARIREITEAQIEGLSEITQL